MELDVLNSNFKSVWIYHVGFLRYLKNNFSQKCLILHSWYTIVSKKCTNMWYSAYLFKNSCFGSFVNSDTLIPYLWSEFVYHFRLLRNLNFKIVLYTKQSNFENGGSCTKMAIFFAVSRDLSTKIWQFVSNCTLIKVTKQI